MAPALAFKWCGNYCRIGQTWFRWYSLNGEYMPVPKGYQVHEGLFYLA